MTFTGLVYPWCKTCEERHSYGDPCCVQALAAAVLARKNAPPLGCPIADWTPSWKMDELSKVDTATAVYLRYGGEPFSTSIVNRPEDWVGSKQESTADWFKRHSGQPSTGQDDKSKP